MMNCQSMSVEDASEGFLELVSVDLWISHYNYNHHNHRHHCKQLQMCIHIDDMQ